MSHIGNANKMVSDTPISDSTPHNVAELGMLCRKLKRELNAANVEIEEKRKDIVYLATEKAKLEDRIKRLEEAGIELRECASWVGHSCCQYVDQIRRAKAAIETWDKEAKL
jgi:predicted  nucleic acid-binding Zn-ribbon protein